MVDDARKILEESVKGKTDEEIMGFVETMGGSETVLTMVFEGMKAAINPEKAQDAVIGFELTENGTTHAFTVTVQGGTAAYEKAAPTDARVTLGLSVPDYLRLVAGELDGIQAFMQGKLKLQGDMMFAQQVPMMFGLS